MRIVLRFSHGSAVERLFLGGQGPHRVEIVLSGGALFGPRRNGGVVARQPELYVDGQIRMALICGDKAFDTFMSNAVEQTGKPFDWTWLVASRMKGWLPRAWRNPDSWSGAEMIQWLSEMAEIPILKIPSNRLVTTQQLLLAQKPNMCVVGRYATSDEWQRWKVWGK